MDARTPDLEHIFKHHPPTGDAQLASYHEIREAGKAFAQVIVNRTPAGADQTCAIRHIRDAVMTANASIATGGRLDTRG